MTDGARPKPDPMPGRDVHQLTGTEPGAERAVVQAAGDGIAAIIRDLGRFTGPNDEFLKEVRQRRR